MLPMSALEQSVPPGAPQEGGYRCLWIPSASGRQGRAAILSYLLGSAPSPDLASLSHSPPTDALGALPCPSKEWVVGGVGEPPPAGVGQDGGYL